VEYGWPVGMPVCRPLGTGLWEVRTDLAEGRTARVLFCVHGRQMVLLHGFMKKTQKIPRADVALARTRMRALEFRIEGKNAMKQASEGLSFDDFLAEER